MGTGGMSLVEENNPGADRLQVSSAARALPAAAVARVRGARRPPLAPPPPLTPRLHLLPRR